MACLLERRRGAAGCCEGGLEGLSWLGRDGVGREEVVRPTYLFVCRLSHSCSV